MRSLKEISEDTKIPPEELLRILEIPEWVLEIGLDNYQFNEPMEEFFLKKIEHSKSTRSNP